MSPERGSPQRPPDPLIIAMPAEDSKRRFSTTMDTKHAKGLKRGISFVDFVSFVVKVFMPFPISNLRD